MTKEVAVSALKDFVKLHDNLLIVRVVPAEVLDIVIEAIKTVLPLIEEANNAKQIGVPYMKLGDGWWVAENNENYSPFDGSEENVYRCSVCYKKESRATKYCPNCGSFMFTREPEVFNNDK